MQKNGEKTCSPNVPQMFPESFPNVFGMFPELLAQAQRLLCSLNVPRMFPECFLIIIMMEALCE